MRSISLFTARTSRFVLILGAALIGLSTAAMAQGCGPSNPNCIVPTPPVTTCNNQAASTQFVCNALGHIGPEGMPAPPFNAVQFNKAGVFGGSANFLWDNTDQILSIGTFGTYASTVYTDTIGAFNAASGSGLLGDSLALYGGAPDPIGSGLAGGAVSIYAGDGNGGSGGAAVLEAGSDSSTGAGGIASLIGGSSAGGGGGAAAVTAGNDSSTGAGGAVNVTAGNSAGGGGGAAAVTAGTDSSTGAGGAVNLTAGNSAGGGGGSVVITAGNDSVSSSGGAVNLTAGNGSGGSGGGVTITAGNDTVSSYGGTISLIAGTGNGLGGGIVELFGGTDNVAGPGGGVYLYGAYGPGAEGGGPIVILAGASGTAPGGGIAITAGDSSSEAGGDIALAAGTGTPNGNIEFPGLPTSDPGGACVGFGCIWSYGGSVVLSGFTPQYVTPQTYDALCGTGGHDCTAAIVSCGTSGSLCYVPCGSYDVTSANLKGHAVKVNGAGYCSNIILTNTTDTGILVGNSSASYLSGVVVRDLHFTAAAAQSAGAGLEITYCSNCSFERLWFDGGNLFDGVAINNSTQVALNSVQIYNCLDDGVRFYSTIGLLIDADSFAGGCTANGFHASGNAAGIEINGTGLLNTANGFFCDKADIATANGQFFFGSFSDFDTNGMWGLNFGIGCIASGGADGFMFHGWASSNATGGIAISAQGGIYATIVGAQILGNGQSTSGHGVFYDDSGAGSIITLTGNTIAFNGAYAALFSAQPNVGIINGNATYNTTGSFSGFVPSGSLLICTANAGQASIGAGC